MEEFIVLVKIENCVDEILRVVFFRLSISIAHSEKYLYKSLVYINDKFLKDKGKFLERQLITPFSTKTKGYVYMEFAFMFNNNKDFQEYINNMKK